MDYLRDLLAAFAVVMNGLPPAMLALTYGFAAFPTALAFLAGSAGMLIFNQVAPISFQTESIVLAGQLGRDRNERLNIVFWTGALMTLLGALGLLEAIISFIGTPILNGMMAGVGIILAKAGVDMIKKNVLAGGIAVVVALFVYFLTSDLIYTIVISVFASSLVWIIKNRKETGKDTPDIDPSLEKFDRLKFKMTPRILKNTLALCTLQIGGNIAYAGITAGLAEKPVNVDCVTIYSGIGDSISALFGGGPVEAIISGTAVAPHPQLSGILLMLILAAILLTKKLPVVAKYVPNQCIAGFLFVLGAIVVFPGNASSSLAEMPVVAGVTTVVTATTDPFIGMIAGVLVRTFIGWFPA